MALSGFSLDHWIDLLSKIPQTCCFLWMTFKNSLVTNKIYNLGILSLRWCVSAQYFWKSKTISPLPPWIVHTGYKKRFRKGSKIDFTFLKQRHNFLRWGIIEIFASTPGSNPPLSRKNATITSAVWPLPTGVYTFMFREEVQSYYKIPPFFSN